MGWLAEAFVGLQDDTLLRRLLQVTARYILPLFDLRYNVHLKRFSRVIYCINCWRLKFLGAILLDVNRCVWLVAFGGF